jgi:salicylate hydroxylase
MALALFLRANGHKPEIFERFDTPKPVGSGLLIQPSGQFILGKLGLLDALRAEAAPVNRLYGISVASGKRALDMEYRHLGDGCSAWGTHRATLFNLLFAELQSVGIKVHTDCLITDESAAFSSAAAQFDIVVDAMGARSPFATGQATQLPFGAYWANVDAIPGDQIGRDALDQRYLRARQMAGIMPIGISPTTKRPAKALFWSARHDEVAKIERAGIGKWQDDFIELWPEAEPYVRQITAFEQLTFARYSHRTGKSKTRQNMLHIGDAWHCTSPQLGQGANMALLDAYALSQALQMADNLAHAAILYANLRADHVRLYQAMSAIFTPLYQSDGNFGPWLRDQVVHNFARWPGVRSLIAHIVGGSFGNRVFGI